MVLHLLLLGSASALHPDLRRLESLAVQQFGHRQLASFKEANRQLNEIVGTNTDPTSSANNGDVSSMCANEQFLQFCAMSDSSRLWPPPQMMALQTAGQATPALPTCAAS